MIEVSSLGRMLDTTDRTRGWFGERDKELSFSRIEFGPCTLGYMYGEVWQVTGDLGLNSREIAYRDVGLPNG